MYVTSICTVLSWKVVLISNFNYISDTCWQCFEFMEQHRGCNESSSSNPQVSLKTIGDLALAMMSKQPTYQTEMFTSDRTLYIRMLKSNSTTLTEADITKPRLKSTDAVNILLCHCTPVISYLHAVNSSAFHTSRAKILQVFQHIRD